MTGFDMQSQIAVVVGILAAGLLLLYTVKSLRGDSDGEGDEDLRSLMDFYRDDPTEVETEDPLLTPESESNALSLERRETSLDKRLRYAQLENVPPYMVSVAQVVISLSAFLIARMFLREVLQVTSLMLGPIIVNKIIERRI